MTAVRKLSISTSLLFSLLCAGGVAAQDAAQPGAQPANPPTEQPTPPPVAAEPSPASTAAPEAAISRRTVEEQIIVTGSRIRRKDLTTAAPVTVLTHAQFEESGKLTIGDFLQSLPEQGNAPNFQLNNGGATYGADGSTRINLRSLGVNRTLVLLNGRRFVPGGLGASPSVDLNSIPSAAIERVEVLKDGASAVYGSDAIAGVVNVITRRNFNGTEAAAQYGISGAGDAQTFDAHVTTGRSGELGSFLFSVGYFNQKDSFLRDRDWSAHALTYDYVTDTTAPGGSRRTPEGTLQFPADAKTDPGCIANPICNKLVVQDPTWKKSQYYIRDPAAPTGFRKMTNADKYNFASVNYLTIPSTAVQVYSSGDTNIGSVARGYFEASYVQRNAQQNAAPFPLNPGDYTVGGGSTAIQVSRDNGFNPFGVPLDFAGRRLVEFGNRTYTQDLGTFRIVTGLDGTLSDSFGPLRGWFWDGSMNYGRTTGTFTTGGAIRNSRIADAVGPSQPDAAGVQRCVTQKTPVFDPNNVIPGCSPINLFGGANNGSIDPTAIDNLGFTGTSRAFDAMYAVDLNTTGPLFTLAADRPVSLALGYEFRRQSGAQIADPIAASGDSADFNFKSTEGFYTVHEAYAELSVPLLSNLPFVRELEASVAGRYVNYSTFGGNFTYKLGARYSPIPDVTLRGTFSTAFRAPTISELYLGASETDPAATDPCNDLTGASAGLKTQCAKNHVPASGSGDGGAQELTRNGGNPGLNAETANIFTVGVVLTPAMVRDLSITLDYYNIAIDNGVGTIGTAAIIAGCFTGDSGPSYQPYCDLITRASNGRIRFVSDINQNVGQNRTSGIDLAVRYAIPSPVGRFGLSFDGNYLAKFDRTLLLATGAQTTHGVGNFDLGALPAIKANAGVNWALAGLNAGVLMRYVGTFKECANPDPADLSSSGGICTGTDQAYKRQVGHNVVVDLHAGYALASPAGRTSFVVGLNNVFDQAPQYVYSAPLANSDPSIYDFLGRYVYGRVQHTF